MNLFKINWLSFFEFCETYEECCTMFVARLELIVIKLRLESKGMSSKMLPIQSKDANL